jgi:hypothetical protein
MTTNPGAAARRLKACQDARRLAPMVAAIKASRGTTMSLQALARALTARGVLTPRGGRWSATTVARVLRRIAELDNA